MEALAVGLYLENICKWKDSPLNPRVSANSSSIYMEDYENGPLRFDISFDWKN